MNTSKDFYKDENEDDDEEDDERQIRWSDLIFLPFHPVFRSFILLCVIVKSTLGPIQSVFKIIHCSDLMEQSIGLAGIKYFYLYLCDPAYFIDTALHIVHRQVTDKAMRREYLPKSGFLLLIDVLSIIPMYSLASNELCSSVQFWPNILSFSEFLIIYRVVEYFSLASTHSLSNLLVGYGIIILLCVNCTSCFFLLLTRIGLCNNCDKGLYDWRQYIIHKFNESDAEYSTYVYGTSFVLSFVIGALYDSTKPSTILEFFLVLLFLALGYILSYYIILPKLFAESTLEIKRVCQFYTNVKKITDETKRRNPNSDAHILVGNFYSIIWKKRSGLTNIPRVISELPRYISLEIKQDLVWPVFYHSPTLRNTSLPFKRWLCDNIFSDYKLPGATFFSGSHTLANLYYLKSGIVELISADDETTPLLTVTSGTLFGDVNFYVPPMKRNVIVRCVTYCEIFIVPRNILITALHHYPEDRCNILQSVKDRLKHAKTLYTCKQNVRGLDRVEDEGIAWLKRRWWEIAETVTAWKKKTGNIQVKCELPPEEAIYHCAKYIGQLVLCSDVQLHKKTLFANVNFPWVFRYDSTFVRLWNNIVIATVLIVLIIYPPNVTSLKRRTWFFIFQYWTDFIYVSDICISLLTSTNKENISDEFSAVVFARCKRPSFILDIFSTLWLETIVVNMGFPQFYDVFQSNRLLKIYILFDNRFLNEWSTKSDPLFVVCYKLVLIIFCYLYISAYAVYAIDAFLPSLTSEYFFGIRLLKKYTSNVTDIQLEENFFDVALAYTFETWFYENLPKTLSDVYVVVALTSIGFLTYTVVRAKFLSFLYLKHIEFTSYQTFVLNLKNYYKHYKIHSDLLKRLDRYLICQWKYNRGRDIMHRNKVKELPSDIFWKVHGEVAEKLISESKAFVGADPTMIRELAYATQFMIMPKKATIYLFGVQCKNVTWLVQGYLKCEYHNEDGELLKKMIVPGEMVSVSSVLLGIPSIRTYLTCTECELMYIRVQDFFNIIKRYPHEWSYFRHCIDEFTPIFEATFHAYVKKHRDYQKKLRERVFHSRASVVSANKHKKSRWWTSLKDTEWRQPNSTFMHYWFIFRTISVIFSIVAASLQGGSGFVIRPVLIFIGYICNCIGWIDISLKLFMGHFDSNGLLITNRRKCVIHYLTRGFLLDFIGCFSWHHTLSWLISQKMEENDAMLMNTFCKVAHMYIVTSFFDYIYDSPLVNGIYIQILKWQLVLILLLLICSHYLMNQCIMFIFDAFGNMQYIRKRQSCWLPKYINMTRVELTTDDLHLIFAQSLNLAQCGFMRMNLGKFHIDRDSYGIGIILIVLGILYCYIASYSLTLLVLSSRSDNMFHRGVTQLQKFLRVERIDEKLIDKATAHFSYWWRRTRGINMHLLMSERIGLVFRQDLNYYFYKRTFSALDTLLLGGEPMERHLCSLGTSKYFRPGEEIIREMDLTASLYVVHRGRVIISREEDDLAVLTKGGIFGPLDAQKARPVRISAQADDFADVVEIPLTLFQDNINDEVRARIAENIQSKDDYMSVKRHIPANPYNTIEYILRGRKVIKLPYMKEPLEASEGNWYSKWLYLSLLFGPSLSAAIVLPFYVMKGMQEYAVYSLLIIFDLIHLAHFVQEFFAIELTVIKDALIKKRAGYRVLKHWGFYVDLLSLILPCITLITGDKFYQLARLLRLRLLSIFSTHFCTGFKSRLTPVLKIVVYFLLLHTITCGWIFVACQGELPIPSPQLPPYLNILIDYDEWAAPKERQEGCPKVSFSFKENNTDHTTFLVPRYWKNDYMVAFFYVMILLSQTLLDTVVCLSISQIYYKVCVTNILLFMDLWLVSQAIRTVYSMFREMYQYDYSVGNLARYLTDSGTSPVLLNSVTEYTKQLWRRQRGNWLPELTLQAPICLQEDLLGALYLYHLEMPPIFKNLPKYFLRQIATRLQRVVVFPGKCIVQEGDIFSCMYFIHEGEVEKWYNNAASGEKKLLTLLCTNQYFGIIPGFYPSYPFHFSYYTRTVVDMVYLRLSSWQDILEAYPILKEQLYESAERMKRELCLSQHYNK